MLRSAGTHPRADYIITTLYTRVIIYTRHEYYLVVSTSHFVNCERSGGSVHDVDMLVHTSILYSRVCDGQGSYVYRVLFVNFKWSPGPAWNACFSGHKDYASTSILLREMLRSLVLRTTLKSYSCGTQGVYKGMIDAGEYFGRTAVLG